MIDRLGNRRATYYAKEDYTSGYHQVALHPAFAHLAAFITEEGFFAPTRLMFGPKSAPSFFQGEIATNVLGGSLHIDCELYIDYNLGKHNRATL